MEDLCSRLSDSSIWCSDENYVVLCKDIQIMERFLFDGMHINFQEIRDRAHHYRRIVKFPYNLSLLLDQAISAENDLIFSSFMYSVCVGIRTFILRLEEAHKHRPCCS